MIKTLSKSRFKLALECNTKAYYDANRDVYANQSATNEFLNLLAFGGNQFGELVKYWYKQKDPLATVKSLDVGLVETNLEVAGTKSFNKSSYTIKTGYLNRQSVGDHKATVTMIDQTNSIGFGDKSNNIYYAGVGADLDLSIFKLSLDLNQYLGDAEGFQGMVKLSSSF